MVSKEFNVATLRSIPLFKSFDDATLEELRPALKVHRMGAGEVVVREGDAADRLFVLVAGEVQVVKNYLEPGAQTVDFLSPPACFGEMALVGQDCTRSATVVSTEPCHFVSLTREAFRSVLLNNPEVALGLLEEAFRRLRQANELLTVLQQQQ
jgi:CRP-like cAMP-binding protein